MAATGNERWYWSHLSFPALWGVSALLSFSNLTNIRCLGDTLGCRRLMGRGKGASHQLSSAHLLKDPSHCEGGGWGLQQKGRAELVRCLFILTQHPALLGESSWSLIAQACSPTPPPTLYSQLKHCRAQRAAKSTFPAKSLPPPSLPRCCLRGSGAILKPRFPGVKSQHLNSECQCSILLSATRLDCRPARESGLVAHWVTSHLFSSILCCHKFIPARCG